MTPFSLIVEPPQIPGRFTANIIGTVTSNVYGGYTNHSGRIIDNTVNISGIASGDVYGGYGSADVISGNTVNISGAVGGNVYGGYISGPGDITNNIIDISGAVGGDVYGGYTNGPGNVTNSTVTLNQGTAITGGVYGGRIMPGGGMTNGNTLNVNRFSGSVREINAFRNYNFNLPLGLYAGDTLITITGSTATDLAGTHVTVSNQFSPGAFANTGDTITLISQANGPFGTGFSGIGYGGISEVYNLDLHDNAGALVLEARSITANPQTKALSQWLMSEILTLNRATDLITGAGLEQAKAALKKQSEGPALFASASYANTRTKTGSHIDADGWAGLVGLAWEEDTPDDTGWMASGFIEGGQGKWSAFNDFTGYNSVFSSGDTDYFGIGALGHYRFENRVRLEASARFGHVGSDYKARGYAAGLQPEFDLGGMYYSAHAGIGYDFDLNDKLNLDLVSRYLWTHREGETVTILNERVHFDSINSHRIRAGGRLTYEAAPGIRTYAGLYGEYEFDGESRARNLTANVRHDPMKIRGATGIAEIGVSVTPAASPNLNVDFALQGHAGRRDGFVGNVALSWKF